MADKKKSERYSGDMAIPPENKTVQRNDVEITFRENRKFDLRIGRNTTVFRGRETKIIPAEWLKTKDFAQQKHKFIVKGGIHG